MNINRYLKEFPAPDVLLQRLRTYAIIDVIMTEGDGGFSKIYQCATGGPPGVALFTIDEGVGNHYHVLFSRGCCIVKGFYHESKLSPYNFTEKKRKDYHIYDNAPPALLQLLDDPALEKEWATFCAWRLNTDNRWHAQTMDIPDDWHDGSSHFVYYTANLDEYAALFRHHYDEPEDRSAIIGSIYGGNTIIPEMITTLNFQANVARVLTEIDRIDTAVLEAMEGGQTRRSRRAQLAEVVDDPVDLELGLPELKPEVDPVAATGAKPAPASSAKPAENKPFGEDFVRGDIAKTPDALSDFKFAPEPDWIKDVFNK